MEFAHDDVILAICYYCDNITKYFMTQLNKRFNKLIGHYDVNILNISAYCAFYRAHNIRKWFVSHNMIITNGNIDKETINAAIKSHDNDLVMSYNITKLSIKQIRTAVKVGNNEIIERIMPDYINKINRSSMSCIIKHNNTKLMKTVLERNQITIEHNMLQTACKNIDMMDVLEPRIDGCVCYLSIANRQIVTWCKSRLGIKHVNHTRILTAIDSDDNTAISKACYHIVTTANDHIVAKYMLTYILIKYIESNNFEKFKLMMTFSAFDINICANLIKYSRVEMLKYIKDTSIMQVMNFSLIAIEYSNIEMIEYLYEIDHLRINIIRKNAVEYRRIDLIDWIDKKGLERGPEDSKLTGIACKLGDLELLKALRVRNYEWDEHSSAIAYNKCDWRLLRWIYNNGCPIKSYILEDIKKINEQFGGKFKI